MKSLLIVAAIIGIIYLVFFDSKKPMQDERPEVIYQREVEKAEQLEDSLQEIVDQRLQESDNLQ